MTYAFRLTVALPPGERFNLETTERTIKLAPPLGRVVMRGTPRDVALSTVGELFFSAGGYADEAAATEAGQLLMDAIRLASASLLRGVDAGQEEVRSVVSEWKKAEIEREQGVQLLQDLLGLQVYEELAEPRVIQVRATGIVNANFDAFEEHVRAFQGRHLTVQRAQAYNLFAKSRFENSLRAHHLDLVAALEVMASPRPRAGRARAILDQLVSVVDDELAGELDAEDEDALETLRAAINNLRRESMSSAVRRLVDESDLPRVVVGMATPTALKESLRVRHKLAHSTATDDEVRPLYGPLEQIVGHLICAPSA